MQQNIGIILRKNNDNTCVIICTKKSIHTKYLKHLKRTKTFIVHNLFEQAKEGNIVLFKSCRPISKKKNWIIQKILS